MRIFLRIFLQWFHWKFSKRVINSCFQDSFKKSPRDYSCNSSKNFPKNCWNMHCGCFQKILPYFLRMFPEILVEVIISMPKIFSPKIPPITETSSWVSIIFEFRELSQWFLQEFLQGFLNDFVFLKDLWILPSISQRLILASIIQQIQQIQQPWPWTSAYLL